MLYGLVTAVLTLGSLVKSYTLAAAGKFAWTRMRAMSGMAHGLEDSVSEKLQELEKASAEMQALKQEHGSTVQCASDLEVNL